LLKRRAKAALYGSTKKGKSSPPKKATRKKKDAYSRLQGLFFQKVRMNRVDVGE
jgi:hypothetical protein